MSKQPIKQIPLAEFTTLDAAYRRTIYEVFAQGNTIRIQLDEPNPALDKLLVGCEPATWTFITAYNPYSQTLVSQENERRNQQLVAELQQRGLDYWAGVGRDAEGGWLAEASYWVMGMGRQEAIALGQAFEQNAILYGMRGQQAELVWLVTPSDLAMMHDPASGE